MPNTNQKCILCCYQKHEIIRDTLRGDIKRKVLKCKNCGFVFLEETDRDLVSYYSQSDYRDQHTSSLDSSFDCQKMFDTHLPFQEKIISHINHIVRPDMSVLDVGCSVGYFLSALKDKIGERVGIELGSKEVSFVEKNLDFKVYSRPIEDLDIPEAPFDLITSFWVLEHVDNPIMFLQKIKENLSPYGYVFLKVPNVKDALLSVYNSVGYSDFYFRDPHLWYFSCETLGLLLRQVGFTGVLKTVQSYNFLNHMHWKLTGTPQNDFMSGNTKPALVDDESGGLEISKELNRFIQKADREYRSILEKHNLGEDIIFIGQKDEGGTK
ncbi:MAG: class I SAM-dependent methyltransferase [Candidatus Marinimicrobia bacterium]|nr:class I SAM-dependent methyltransferase [Candidatus Neomarinimicrobiota bacterium]